MESIIKKRPLHIEKSFLGVNRLTFSGEGLMLFIWRSMAEKIVVKSG